MDSMMKGQGGIQMLLTAEQEAQQIVSNAKNLKMTRLKQAKAEAEEEVQRYRSQLETEYQNNVSKTTGSSGSNVKRLDEETDLKIQSFKEKASGISPKVVSMLVNYVTSAKS